MQQGAPGLEASGGKRAKHTIKHTVLSAHQDDNIFLPLSPEARDQHTTSTPEYPPSCYQRGHQFMWQLSATSRVNPPTAPATQLQWNKKTMLQYLLKWKPEDFRQPTEMW